MAVVLMVMLPDDFLTNPCSAQQMRASMESSLTNYIASLYTAPADNWIRGPVMLDFLSQTAYFQGEDMRLSPKEFALLYYLASREGEAVSKQSLYEEIWKMPIAEDDTALKNAIYRLRKKIIPAGFCIDSVRGVGYCIDCGERLH